MTTPAISTEGRVFVAQLTRDLSAREIAGAGALLAGAKTWTEAVNGFSDALCAMEGPVKRARAMRAAVMRLKSICETGACFINCSGGRSRSAYFEILAFEVAKHPLVESKNAGILVKLYRCIVQRNGCVAVYRNDPLAFVSWHALARMRERSQTDILLANGVVAMCGFAGMIMRRSEKHIDNSIGFAVENMLCVGVLRTYDKMLGFFDVLTVLPPDDVRPANVPLFEQGFAVADAVRKYLDSNDPIPKGYADDIPVLPFNKNDYVTRKLTES